MKDLGINQNMNVELSVIIPIYNVAEYMDASIASLALLLNNKTVEIILIDDGSSDASGKIADQLSAKYSNLTTYHKQNGGLSSARNFGLKCAKGEYIYFFDSDDQLLEGFPAVLIEVIRCKTAEVVLFGYRKLFEDGSQVDFLSSYPMTSLTLSKKQIFDELLGVGQGFIAGHAPTKIFKRTLISDLRFREMNFEDTVFFVEALERVENGVFEFINTPGYLYYQRPGSITHNPSEQNLLDRLQMLDLVYAILKGNHENDDILDRSLEMLFIGNLWVAKLNQKTHSTKIRAQVRSTLRVNWRTYFRLFHSARDTLKYMLYAFIL